MSYQQTPVVHSFLEIETENETSRDKTTTSGSSTRKWVAAAAVAIFVVVVVAGAMSRGTPRAQQKMVSPKGDIAFGSVVNDVNAYPYTVDIRIAKNGLIYTCTGVLLASEWVLTAAHCAEGAANNGLTITAGSIVRNPRTAGAQTRTSSRFEFHANSGIRDVVLVKVSAPFDLSSAAVGTIDISANRPAVGTALRAIGWGTTETGASSNNLKTATMNVIADANCPQIEVAEICTQRGNGNTCGGDSGGPLVQTQNGVTTLVGINSWSITDCANLNGNVDVFESMPSYRDWVHGILMCQVILYQHGTFGGSAYTIAGNNACAESFLPDCSPSIPNDVISSVKTTCKSITLYEHGSLAGTSKTLSCGDYSWLPDVGFPNDVLSSMKINDAKVC